MFFPSRFSSPIGNIVAETTAMSAEQTARNAEHEVRSLQFDVDRLLMITEALWTILKEKYGYSDEDLRKMVEAIDLRDGKIDGRIGKGEPRTCPGCGRVAAKNRPVCLYCGVAVPVDPFGR
jgi:hypothetical protein